MAEVLGIFNPEDLLAVTAAEVAVTKNQNLIQSFDFAPQCEKYKYSYKDEKGKTIQTNRSILTRNNSKSWGWEPRIGDYYRFLYYFLCREGHLIYPGTATTVFMAGMGRKINPLIIERNPQQLNKLRNDINTKNSDSDLKRVKKYYIIDTNALIEFLVNYEQSYYKAPLAIGGKTRRLKNNKKKSCKRKKLIKKQQK